MTIWRDLDEKIYLSSFDGRAYAVENYIFEFLGEH